MKKVIINISALILFISCGRNKHETAASAASIERIIKLKGSETIRNVVEKFINYYDAENPQVVLDYSGGGSVIGLMSFKAHESDIIFVSKELTPEEKEGLEKEEAIIDTLAIDGVSIIINISNPVKQLSLRQLSDIYSGKITNWQEVGGDNMPITLYSRDISSGTYSFFKERVLDSLSYAGNDINLTHNEEIVNNVSSTRNAIGYVGISYSQNPTIKAIPIEFTAGQPAFFPNYQNIIGNNYLLKRYILMVYSKQSDEHIKKLMLAVKNEKTFKIINESGLIPYKSNFE